MDDIEYPKRFNPFRTKGHGNYWSQFAENPWRDTRDGAFGAAASGLFFVQGTLALRSAAMALVPDAVEAVTGSKSAGNWAARGIDLVDPIAGSKSNIERGFSAMKRTFSFGQRLYHTDTV